jgi:protein phosphatase
MLDVEIHEHHLLPGDIYLLCSDGLSDMLDDAEIREILATKGGLLNAACNALVDHANSKGGRDNISVILVRIVPPPLKSWTLFSRVLDWFR